MPFALAGRLVVQAASSMDPGADAAGTLYLNCLFRPGLPQPLVDQIYAWVMAVAIPAALPAGSRARVTWRRSVPPSAPHLGRVGVPLVPLGGGYLWTRVRHRGTPISSRSLGPRLRPAINPGYPRSPWRSCSRDAASVLNLQFRPSTVHAACGFRPGSPQSGAEGSGGLGFPCSQRQEWVTASLAHRRTLEAWSHLPTCRVVPRVTSRPLSPYSPDRARPRRMFDPCTRGELIGKCLILDESAVCLRGWDNRQESWPPRTWSVAGKFVADVGWVSRTLR